ncbi:hypothetical protein [Ferviditalea candida]|uniref:Uncharacterized protein n=1 Tax=Ferviditalea candida TaxID=3108399 RepID=A0ABU5ZNH1_9BACL|nr:hypothetical protein [Paenibacillaceae bacterium T2]
MEKHEQGKGPYDQTDSTSWSDSELPGGMLSWAGNPQQMEEPVLLTDGRQPEAAVAWTPTNEQPEEPISSADSQVEDKPPWSTGHWSDDLIGFLDGTEGYGFVNPLGVSKGFALGLILGALLWAGMIVGILYLMR